MNTKYKFVSILAAVIIALDQISKIWVQGNISMYESIPVIPGFFDLVHVLNKGAAFGFLNRADIHWQTYFFIGVSALAVVLIFHLVNTVDRRDPPLFTGLGCILGGALGNMIDRIRIGQVIDFLDFHIASHHWPAFNIADMAISVGALLLLVSFYQRKKNASRFN
ncbi:signal peptidase II [Desulfoplanes formicivorans]|uniref:Lipoprotein signal peptidase n=1 Tax=Desulfoplanes formicivorans TaxID=1592317 RepID=A0A194AF71_9BACT|nr:signal peptidase II [Desulfoplanes formicivorans]GAU07845.1 peptidase A8 [Desulfoplanes formicivorans]